MCVARTLIRRNMYVSTTFTFSVPSYWYKIVYDHRSHKTVAFWMPNAPIREREWYRYRTTSMPSKPGPASTFCQISLTISSGKWRVTAGAGSDQSSESETLRIHSGSL